MERTLRSTSGMRALADGDMWVAQTYEDVGDPGRRGASAAVGDDTFRDPDRDAAHRVSRGQHRRGPPHEVSEVPAVPHWAAMPPSS
jgi:hypothetical protein